MSRASSMPCNTGRALRDDAARLLISSPALEGSHYLFRLGRPIPYRWRDRNQHLPLT